MMPEMPINVTQGKITWEWVWKRYLEVLQKSVKSSWIFCPKLAALDLNRGCKNIETNFKKHLQTRFYKKN